MNNGSFKTQLEEARKLHNDGVAGDKNAAIKANARLSRLRETYPDHAVIEAYYGSSLVLVARDTVKLLEKEEKARDGLDALHRAVELDPDNKEVRLLRGNVCLRLPDIYFQTARTAVEDFTYLYKRQQADPSYLSPKQWQDVKSGLKTATQKLRTSQGE